MRRADCFSADNAVLRHFMKGRPGWWVLHALAVIFTLWLGAATRFAP